MNEEVADLALVHSIETFYTGGSVEWSTDGDTIFTTCTNVVKALRIDDGTTRYCFLSFSFNLFFNFF